MARTRRRVGALTPAQVKARLKARQTRRWLTRSRGDRLYLPAQLKGKSKKSRAARAAWEAMHRAGDEAERIEQREGITSPAAHRERATARLAQEEMLSILGLTREEAVSGYSLTSQQGRDFLALLRY
jgi:hypothetical protein